MIRLPSLQITHPCVRRTHQHSKQSSYWTVAVPRIWCPSDREHPHLALAYTWPTLTFTGPPPGTHLAYTWRWIHVSRFERNPMELETRLRANGSQTTSSTPAAPCINISPLILPSTIAGLTQPGVVESPNQASVGLVPSPRCGSTPFMRLGRTHLACKMCARAASCCSGELAGGVRRVRGLVEFL